MAQQLALLQPKARSSHDVVELIKETHTEELVIALCGPIGSPLHVVSDLLKEILKDEYGYDVKVIKYVDIIKDHKILIQTDLEKKKNDGEDHSPKYKHIRDMIEAGNILREKFGYSVLSEIAIKKISIERSMDKDVVRQIKEGIEKEKIEYKTRRVCYILDSLKHEDELTALQAVYSGLFYFFGVFSPISKRKEYLCNEKHISEYELYKLIDRDSGEDFAHGQHMRQTFTKSDFFIRIEDMNHEIIKNKLKRFVDLIFGTKQITPTIHETAMYLAASAAGNSACMSRQVGAALTDANGELLSVGWNDVPKYGGDLYKEPIPALNNCTTDERCFKRDGGRCINDKYKREMKEDIVNLLLEDNVIKETDKEKVYKIINKTKIDSLIEYSRAIHAEMHAIILGAQKSGRKMLGGKIYCTTYPCHICARHIIVAGIKEVYYIEPYSKSLTTKLHSDAITEDEGEQKKVIIRMFDGVAPSKFLQFFKMLPNSRKKTDGSGESIKISPKSASPKETYSLQDIPKLESIVINNLEKRVKNE
jgi:deoxycytidylate deaminase